MGHLKSYVVCNEQEYYVSTVYTFDNGLETMIFECEDKFVTNWFEVYVRHYETTKEAVEGHDEIVKNIEKYVGGN